jgi:hypothetical protein
MKEVKENKAIRREPPKVCVCVCVCVLTSFRLSLWRTAYFCVDRVINTVIESLSLMSC